MLVYPGALTRHSEFAAGFYRGRLQPGGPRAGHGLPGCLHPGPWPAGGRLCRAHRAPHRPGRRGDRNHPHRRSAARHRQDRLQPQAADQHRGRGCRRPCGPKSAVTRRSAGEFLKALNMAERGDRLRALSPRAAWTGRAIRCGLKAAADSLDALTIVSVADCFDALTTDRSYQKGRAPGARPWAIMARLAGAAFAPELVRVLVEDVRENGLRTRLIGASDLLYSRAGFGVE
ncbi:MAG: hypothetical protein MZV70_15220 [Desulfobacterales bacterium]|nr:hypothetical protein [Desulfobacterales bacterium]